MAYIIHKIERNLIRGSKVGLNRALLIPPINLLEDIEEIYLPSKSLGNQTQIAFKLRHKADLFTKRNLTDHLIFELP